MTEPTQSDDGEADIDAVETSEWLEALDGVIAREGPDRARATLTQMIERAKHDGTGPIGSLGTPYVNTWGGVALEIHQVPAVLLARRVPEVAVANR